MIFLNDQNIYSQYGIMVESVQGHIDLPKAKPSIKHNWEDEHGIEVYRPTYYMESRKITLNCTILASSATDLLNKLEAIKTALIEQSVHHLRVTDVNKAYVVFFENGLKLKRFYKNIGRFDLFFEEVYPKNLQFPSSGGSSSITVNSINGAITVNWGDMTTDTVITATGVYNHTYADSENRIVMIYGDLEGLVYAV